MDSHKERDLGPGHQEFGAAPTAGARGSPTVAQRGGLRFLSDCEPIPTHHPFPMSKEVRPHPAMGAKLRFHPQLVLQRMPDTGLQGAALKSGGGDVQQGN